MNDKYVDSLDYIGVSGFGWTGSGAAVDLIREFNKVRTLGFEFRLLKDPYGILDLEKGLTQDLDFFKQNLAVKNFLRLIGVLSRNDSRYFGRGSGYSEKISKAFVDESNKYITTLHNGSFKNHSMINEYYYSPFEFFMRRLLARLGVKELGEESAVYSVNSVDFVGKTKEYLSKLFSDFASNDEIVILDQAIPVHDALRAMVYFDKIRTVIVDRDPRDIYVELVSRKVLIGAELAETKNIDLYVQWFNAIRANAPVDSDQILNLRFESLIEDYEESLVKIKNFLNLHDHVNQFKYFSPDVSSKNIGKWKNFGDVKVMDQIRSRLGEFCY